MAQDRFMMVNSSNHMICEGIVKEFYHGDAEFQVVNGSNILQALTVGCYIRFVFMEGRKGIFEGEVVDIQGNRITLENIRSLAKYVKDDVRIDTDFETKIFHKNENGDILAWKVRVADISAGGVRLLCDRQIPLNQVMEVAIPYQTSYIIVDAAFLRESIEVTEHGRYYNYGCKFSELANTTERMVRSMVFQIAAKKARKAGGLS